MLQQLLPPLSLRPHFSLPGGNHHLSSMATLMQSNNEPVAISNPLSGPSNTIISSPPESVAFLKQSSKPESNLSSIASAGLHVSRSRDQLPPPPTPTNMATPTTAATTQTPTATIDHRSLDQQDKESDPHNSSQVAREALGASEKSQQQQQQQTQSINDSMALPSDQMQVDSHPNPANHDAYGPPADNGNATSLLNAPTTVASPGPIEDSASQDGDRPRHRDEAEIAEEASNKAFSYPMPAASFNDSRRGLSLPSSGFGRSGQRSPGSKKHRCPYCATEFTRHHNLKSHLLTHSQEKPYVCQTCQSRFRRLHDLKRHTKLHTGERPHICPKCGRRFARGDALARHNKGQGGCAGRRSSMGSYVPDDEYGDGTHGHAEDTMDGLVYAEPEPMHEEDERRLHAPSIRKHDASGDSLSRSSTFHSRQPSTYPPIAVGRPSPGGLFPPPTGHGGVSSTSASPISQNGNMTFPPAGQPSGASVFQSAPNNDGSNNNNNNNIESPKPLSPNALSSHHGPDGHQRAHSPFQQQPFGRPPQTTGAGPGLGLPPPQPGVPQLPPPPGMSSTDSRFTLPTPGSVPPSSATAARHTPSHSHSSNHSGGPLAAITKTGADMAPSSGNSYPPHDPNMLESGSREDKLWTYIRSVHEELVGLRTEVSALRAQVASSNVNGGPGSQSLPEGNAVNAGQR